MDTEQSTDRIGDYNVIAKLGGGSFGDVFRVRRENESVDLALKWLRSDASGEGRKRFENEVWALRTLDHAAIPKFVDQGVHEGRPFLVMTLARGESLRRQLQAQVAAGGAFGWSTVLALLDTVLDAVVHMHTRGVFHRDIKDDNIISDRSTSDVHVIDLGFCRGNGQPQEHQTFWLAGAARYSPPAKLEHPSLVDASHDVFAVGVVAFLLLTTNYPWSFADNEDVGVLRERMQRQRPSRVSDLNSLVPSDVSSWVARLLETDDALRPSAGLALEQLRGLRRERAGSAPSQLDSVALSRVVRDPIHGDIRMTETEWRVLSTREMQRLRWIRQLGFTNLVFPGAEHSRLSHSLGAMHVADKVLLAIESRSGVRVDPERRLSARLFALVHDVTHVAFGHTLEDELNLFPRHDGHQARAMRLVLSEGSELGALLRATDYGRAVLASFDSSSTLPRSEYLHELLSGPVGADVLDYIDRDSYFCGLDQRVDSAVFRRFHLAPVRGETDRQMPHLIARLHGGIGVRLDAEYALESVLLNRFLLFMKVYSHPVKTAAGAMLGKALAQANSDSKKLEIAEDELEGASDVELLLRLRASRKRGVRELIEAILQRRLFKLCYRGDAAVGDGGVEEVYRTRQQIFSEKGLFVPASREALEEELAKRAKVKSSDLLLYCAPKAPGYQKLKQMYVERVEGQPRLQDDLTFARIRERHLRLWRVYAFVTPAMDGSARGRVAEACETYFGIKNEVPSQRKQGDLFLGG